MTLLELVRDTRLSAEVQIFGVQILPKLLSVHA